MTELRKLKGIVSTLNSSAVLLPADTGGIDHIFTGEAEDIADFGSIDISVYSDVASATDGLSIEFSSDGSNWYFKDPYTVPAATGKKYSSQRSPNWFRIVYTNGAIAQTEFSLTVIFNQFFVIQSSHKTSDEITSEDDAPINKSISMVATNNPAIFRNADVQNPLATDGDSVYMKDLDIFFCTAADFIYNDDATVTEENVINSLVSDIYIKKTNTTSDAIKTVFLQFKRPVVTSSFGINSGPGGDFSNTKITLAQGDASFVAYDDSADSTKHQIFLFPIEPEKFSRMTIEFHTTDSISIGLIGIFKNIEVAARLQALDSDGLVVDIGASDSGNLKVTDAEDGLAIAKGEVPGSTFIHKFGVAPDFDTSDGTVTIWDGSDDGFINQMQYVYSTTNDIDTISSSNAGDAQDIEIEGLDINYDEVIQTATLNGQNKVTLGTSLLRIFRMTNMGSTDNAGHIYCYVDGTITLGVPDTPADVRAIIQPGFNQTLMALYTIPRLKVGYGRSWFASTAGAKKDSNYGIQLRSRPVGEVFQMKHLTALSDNATSAINHIYVEPEVFQEKTDIEMRTSALATAITQSKISGGFDLVIVDN